MNQSVATISSPEFINLRPLDINPLMSTCEIKVLYVGENRNHTFISKEVAIEMSKTLRGCPIVGYYKKDQEDFGDHGRRVIIEDNEIKFECLTVPYGFVAPNAEVWFQEFEDTNELGEKTIREYLMTTGYLWTGQFEECKSIVEGEGKPHSMELDDDTVQGNWVTNRHGMEFYIINDATFSKLCILGDAVEPCFEGSSIKSPEVSTSFSKVDDTFKHTLYTMMQELKSALEGGIQMDETKDLVQQDVVTEDAEVKTEETPKEDTEVKTEDAPETSAEETPKEEEPVGVATQEEPVQEEGQPTVETEPEAQVEVEVTPVEPTENFEEKYNALQTEFSAQAEKISALETQLSEMTAERDVLAQFKLEVENEKKDEMIGNFFMLSDEDKKDVIDHKSEYSLAEIEEKLSVICYRKKVNFGTEINSNFNNTTEEEKPTTTYTVEEDYSSVPAWIQAIKENSK